jgi:5-bromo-4-chloroindolyl phosphate hydrolysis protein
MSQRFGGKFSPNEPSATKKNPPNNAFRNRRVAPSFMRANLMFIAPLPLLFSGIGELISGDAIGMVSELGALSILLLSAWLLREGIKAQSEYEARKVARPPAIPRKVFAAVLSGIGVFTAAWLGWNQPIISAGIFAALASGAHVFAFGLDPMKKKGMDDFNSFDNDRVARAVEKAEITLAELHDAAERIGDRALEARIERFGASVREVFRAVEDDPRDLTRARKFLGVYLVGAKDATLKFVDLYTANRSVEAREDYIALINDLEISFNTHRETLLLDDREELDIEIEVLRDRLHQEGLTTR